MKQALMDELQKELIEMRKKGMGTDKIAETLNLSTDTVIWLITHLDIGEPGKKLSSDILIDWANIGENPERLFLLGQILSSLVREKLQVDDIEAVLGLTVNGVPLAQEVARTLGKPCVIVETSGEIRFISPFFDREGKKIVLIDHVISTGRTLKKVIRNLKETGTVPLGIFVFVDKRSWKTGKKEVSGVKTYSLVKAVRA